MRACPACACQTLKPARYTSARRWSAHLSSKLLSGIASISCVLQEDVGQLWRFAVGYPHSRVGDGCARLDSPPIVPSGGGVDVSASITAIYNRFGYAFRVTVRRHAQLMPLDLREIIFVSVMPIRDINRS